MEKNKKLLQAYKDYQRGAISLEEYNSIANATKNNNFDFLLEEKLDKEFNTFREKLKTKSPEEIIDKAYELIVKEEINEELKNMKLHDQEKVIMLDQSDLLTEFYHDWLDTDVALGEVLKETLEESVSALTRYYGKQNHFKIKER